MYGGGSTGSRGRAPQPPPSSWLHSSAYFCWLPPLLLYTGLTMCDQTAAEAGWREQVTQLSPRRRVLYLSGFACKMQLHVASACCCWHSTLHAEPSPVRPAPTVSLHLRNRDASHSLVYMCSKSELFRQSLLCTVLCRASAFLLGACALTCSTTSLLYGMCLLISLTSCWHYVHSMLITACTPALKSQLPVTIGGCNDYMRLQSLPACQVANAFA